jgi:hypothetical protein
MAPMRLSLHAQRPTLDTLLLNGVPHWLAYPQCGTSTYGKTCRDTDATVGSLWIRSHQSSQDSHVVPPRMAKRDELV